MEPPMAIHIRTHLEEPETVTAFVPHKPARAVKAEGGRKFVIKLGLLSSGRPNFGRIIWTIADPPR
jgi:hypothetical protein